MGWYILKLVLLLPLIAGLAWGSLKLAVIEFHGREILVSVSRGGLSRLAEAPARETQA